LLETDILLVLIISPKDTEAHDMNDAFRKIKEETGGVLPPSGGGKSFDKDHQ
jgi:hypothetical protein